MTELLTALELHRAGIFVAFATLAGLCLVIQWTCWIAGIGRFASGPPARAATGRPRIGQPSASSWRGWCPC
jgi:hypothetical protein